MSELFSFPNPVNEKAARTVAGGVLISAILILALSLSVSHDWLWALVPVVYGFAARVATGPTLSPLGQLATRVIAPRLGEARPTPGPPKRFAQLIGLVFTGTALVLTAAGLYGAAQVFVAFMIPAAGLESLAGYCLGCKAFALLMKVGVIPESVCKECADISNRYAAAG